MKECLECKKLYQFKREASKFCSDKCRVKWNRHHPKETDTVSKMELKVLYNAVLEMVGKLNVAPKSISMARNDENLKIANKELNSFLDPPKPNRQAEYFKAFDFCESQYEVEQLADKIKNDKILEEWAKKPLYEYGQKLYNKL